MMFDGYLQPIGNNGDKFVGLAFLCGIYFDRCSHGVMRSMWGILYQKIPTSGTTFLICENYNFLCVGGGQFCVGGSILWVVGCVRACVCVCVCVCVRSVEFCFACKTKLCHIMIIFVWSYSKVLYTEIWSYGILPDISQYYDWPGVNEATLHNNVNQSSMYQCFTQYSLNLFHTILLDTRWCIICLCLSELCVFS